MAVLTTYFIASILLPADIMIFEDTHQVLNPYGH
jgi:hypothetical protein